MLPSVNTTEYLDTDKVKAFCNMVSQSEFLPDPQHYTLCDLWTDFCHDEVQKMNPAIAGPLPIPAVGLLPFRILHFKCWARLLMLDLASEDAFYDRFHRTWSNDNNFIHLFQPGDGVNMNALQTFFSMRDQVEYNAHSDFIDYIESNILPINLDTFPNRIHQYLRSK